MPEDSRSLTDRESFLRLPVVNRPRKRMKSETHDVRLQISCGENTDRKYRLCLSLSHHYIDQLPEPIRQAVFGNVGTLIAFRIGYTDVEMLTKEFGKTFRPLPWLTLNGMRQS